MQYSRRAALTGALAASLAACGRSRPSGDLRLQLNWFAGGENCFWYYGVERGLFRDIAQNVSIEGGRGSELAARILSAGRADVAVLGADAFLGAREQGNDLVSLGVLYPTSPIAVYAKESTGIRTLQDLAGKKVGMAPAANTGTMFRATLRKLGMAPNAVQEVSVEGSLLQRVLVEDQIDAAVGFQFDTIRFALMNPPVPVTVLRLADHGMDTIGLMLAARRETTDARPELGRFAEAARRALVATHAAPDDAFASLDRAGVRDLSVEFERAKLDMVLRFACGESCDSAFDQSGRAWSQTVRLLNEAGVLSRDQASGDFILR